MPIYEYICEVCHARFEQYVRSMSQSTEVKCPKCGATDVRKGWSVFGTVSVSREGTGLTGSTSSSCSPAGT